MVTGADAERRMFMKKTYAIVIAVLCIALIVGGYVFWMKQNEKPAENVELTEVQKLITKDLEKNYPATPREVVKTYNEIITCFYNEEYTEAELEALGDQARILMDTELLENNPRDVYFNNLKAEIDDYKRAERIILSSNLCSTNDVQFVTVDERECAYVKTSYFIKDKTGHSRTYQMYVVRKDDDGNWKIHVFYQVEGETSDDE